MITAIALSIMLAQTMPSAGSTSALRDATNVSASGLTVHKFGRNPSVAQSYEVIWDAGGAYTGWMTTAATVQIRSGGNAADTAAGDNCREVAIYGLDENWALANESVATAGASASSATTTTFIRVFRAFCTTVGVYGNTNAGNILIEETGSSALVAQITAGYGQTEMALYTVPAGYTMYLWNIGGSADSTKSTTFHLKARFDADNTSTPSAERLQYSQDASDGFWERSATPIPLKLPEKTDLWFEASIATNSAVVVANFVATLVKN